ncbi:MAG: FCD domain-containing protein, partial [Planctomycetes bacterium]|nr:FCD domain-containing protein [Planctomycetota bacterium]
EYMYDTIANMYDLNSRIRRRFISHHRERMDQSRQEHLAILEYLSRRDGDGAGEAMRQHIAVGMKGALQLPTVPSILADGRT